VIELVIADVFVLGAILLAALAIVGVVFRVVDWRRRRRA
jgi:hypothetical protein